MLARTTGTRQGGIAPRPLPVRVQGSALLHPSPLGCVPHPPPAPWGNLTFSRKVIYSKTFLKIKLLKIL